jgi:adenylate cyclase
VATERVERQLAAILAADVAAYSRLTGVDEEGTHVRLRDLLCSVVDPKVAEYGGRVVKNTGDGLLAEFSSIVDTVRCALDIQRGIAQRNAGVPQDKRIEFRIGINLGDIIIDHGDIFGDGVNVAVRLEGIAEPGGICLSEDAHRLVRRKLELTTEDIGEQKLKNIAQPVHAYRTRPSTAAEIACPHLPVPDKPSIAVLPFSNLSGDQQQDYFTDGISEELITSLSKVGDLFVIARHSAFRYRATNLDAKQVGRELGVRYLLVGSMRRDRNRVRICTQLVDADKGIQLWAESYDRKLTDIFAVQAEVTHRIVTTLVAHITKSELDRTLHKPPESLVAYDYCLQADALMRNPSWTNWGETIAHARVLYEQSIAADPRYALAVQGLAYTYHRAWIEPTNYGTIGQEHQQQATNDRALSLAQRAVELDASRAEAHAMLAWVLSWHYRWNEAIAEFHRAFELNPNLADGRFGHLLCKLGRIAEGINYMKKIMRLDPFHPPILFYFLGNAYYHSDQYTAALEQLRACTDRMPGFRPGFVDRAAAAGQLGFQQEARAAAANVLRLQADFTIAKWLRLNRLARQEDTDRIADGLRKAGLPE